MRRRECERCAAPCAGREAESASAWQTWLRLGLPLNRGEHSRSDASPARVPCHPSPIHCKSKSRVFNFSPIQLRGVQCPRAVVAQRCISSPLASCLTSPRPIRPPRLMSRLARCAPNDSPRVTPASLTLISMLTLFVTAHHSRQSPALGKHTQAEAQRLRITPHNEHLS